MQLNNNGIDNNNKKDVYNPSLYTKTNGIAL